MTTFQKREVGASKLFVIDDLPPEDVAMLQALYSRSADSVERHLERVAKTGSSKFFDNFVVGYGHKSIADCGSTTLFFENVSLLAAKALQDWPLYSGQETSTRYIDMARQPVVDPVGTVASKMVLNRWMDFYKANQGAVAETVRRRYPRKDEEAEEVYGRAVKARVFDILRGFLPAGICTQLSWHTNLRQAGDHLTGLSWHPAEEVRKLAKGARELLHEAYPASGLGESQASVSGVERSKDEERRVQAKNARDVWEQRTTEIYSYATNVMEAGLSTTIDVRELAPHIAMRIFESRPRGCVLPHWMSDLGQITFSSLLDFGSFRDLQRHRNGVCRMPLLHPLIGFESWYVEELDGALAKEATTLINEQRDAIVALTPDPVMQQYYTALGFLVPIRVTYGLPAMVYVLELRSGKTVHPTLRRLVHQMISAFEQPFPMVKLHVDLDPNDWDVRRGKQTIAERVAP